MTLKTVGIVLGSITLVIVLVSIIIISIMLSGKKKGSKHENNLVAAQQKKLAADTAAENAKTLMTGLKADIAVLQKSRTSMAESLIMVDENIEISMLTMTPEGNYYKSGVGSCMTNAGDGQISDVGVGEAIDDCVALDGSEFKRLGDVGRCVGVVAKSSSANGGCLTIGTGNDTNFHRMATAEELAVWKGLHASKDELTRKIDQMDLEIVSRQAAHDAALKVAAEKQTESDELAAAIKSMSSI